ncbi:MAG TPA: HD-GYP domain-containing protein [Gammaproteobacteria bacterium]
MRKKIPVNGLRLGMFIDKLDGNWLQHPFWKSAFRLDTEKQLKTLRESAVTHVWIDTDKGLDVAETAGLAIETAIPPSTAKATTATPAQARIPIEKEMSAARETLEKARMATMAVLQEARMGHSVSTHDVAPLVEEISASIERNASAMLTISRMKTKDDYTYLHSVAVCALMIALGKQLNYQGSLHALGMAGLLHDVGKMAIPDEILNKPGKLTDEEFKVVLEHPRQGWELLKQSDDIDEIALDVCLHHHERVDGKGYPDKLSGEALTLEARMGAICDVYDAITSDRCYKKGWEPAYALKKMAEWKDGHFDETIFQAFVKTIGIYPSGTLLKLKSGRLAVVTEQSTQSLLTPIIKVFYSCNSKAPIPRKRIDLAQSNEQIDSIETPQDWGFNRREITDILDQ